MKGYFFLILAFCFSSVLAQVHSVSSIKNSGDYYWGETVAENAREAEDEALAKLLQTIAVKVSSSFTTTKIESSDNFNETVENILHTYTAATLKDVKTISTKIDENIKVFRYIEKSVVEKIFNERIRLIQNIYDQAEKYENDNICFPI